MNAVDELEIVGSNLATQYSDELYAQPTLLKPLAQAIAKDTQKILAEYKTLEEQIAYISQELLALMNGSVILMNLFVKRIKEENYLPTSEKELLDELEGLQIDENATADVLAGMKETLAGVVKQGLPVEILFYDNYLNEYASNLMTVHILSRLSQRKELLKKLHDAIKDPVVEENLYQTFKLLTHQFKSNLDLTPYSYEEMLEE